MFRSNYLKTQEPTRIVGDYQVDLTFSEAGSHVLCVQVTDQSTQISTVYTYMKTLLNTANARVLNNLFGWHRAIPHPCGGHDLVYARDFFLTTRIGLESSDNVIEVVVAETCEPGFYDRLLYKMGKRLQEVRAELTQVIVDDISRIDNILYSCEARNV